MPSFSLYVYVFVSPWAAPVRRSGFERIQLRHVLPLGIRQLGMRRHPGAAVPNLYGQLVRRRRLAAVSFGHCVVSGAHHLVIQSVAGRAIASLTSFSASCADAVIAIAEIAASFKIPLRRLNFAGLLVMA